MSRESHKIEWMRAYKTGDPRIIDHYQRAYKCDRRKAANWFYQDQVSHWNDRTGSRIQYDKLTDSWRGRRNVNPPREKFGLPRDGDDPNSLRNKLIAAVSDQYLTSDEMRDVFVGLY